MKMLHLHGLAARQFFSAASPLASSPFSHCQGASNLLQ
jgi:hypothetical protein